MSARHPRLTITKERWRHCAVPECRSVEESSLYCCTVAEGKRFLPGYFTAPKEVLQFIEHFFGTTHTTKTTAKVEMRGHDEHSLTLRAT